MDLTLAGIGISLGVGNSASFDGIPTELVIGILSRLPVKTILLTTCVCKRWYSIIKTPAFISAQLSNSISNPIPTNNYILLAPKSSPPDDDHNFYLYSDTNFPSLQAKLKIPFQTLSKSIHIVGSCNGLVCITDFDFSCRGGDIYLINPFINKYKKLSAEGSCYSDLLSMGELRVSVVIGFGYSNIENDYKVFRHLSELKRLGWSKTEIYSLKSGKWKVIDDSAYYLDCLVFPPHVDGCLYWWLPYSNELPCFDLNCEVIRKTEMPANYNIIELRTCTSSIFKLNGSVALFGMDHGRGSIEDRLCLFMMEKDICGQVQWKEFYYEVQDDVHYGIFNYPIGFSGNGRLLFDHRDVSPKDCYTDDDESDVEGAIVDENERLIWKIGVTNLDNLSAIEDITLDFPGYFTIDTNFSAGLVFFVD